MSLINQVLNELEKRGANTPLGEETIRPVPPRKRPNLLLYGLPALAVLALLVAAKWYLGRGERAAEPVVASNASGYALVAAISDAAALEASMPAAESAVVAEASGDAALPASKLSFELSAIPAAKGASDKQEPEADEENAPAPIRKTPVQREQVKSKVATKPESRQVAVQETSPFKQVSPQQHAENEFRKANQAAQQGRVNEAIDGYESVLKLDPLHHQARRALAGVLVGAKRNADAERVLKEGLKRDSHESSFAMMLARLQVERDAVPLALETLQKTLPYAEGQADYHAFVAALLQRESRHKEAVTHFQIALQLTPNNGVWLMGLGISLQAIERNEDARDAYQRALASNSLNAQLQAYVQKKLKEL